MAIIEKSDLLKPLIEVGKTMTKIESAAKAAAGEDGWSKFERIITNIDHLADTLIRVKEGGGQAPLGPGARVLSDPPRLQAAAPPANSEVKNQMNTALKNLLAFLANHVNQCAKENPNMTLGECINKLPVNVTQLSALIQLAGKK